MRIKGGVRRMGDGDVCLLASAGGSTRCGVGSLTDCDDIVDR